MNEIKPSLDGTGLRIAIVRSRFNEEVGRASLEACLVRLMELGVHERDVTVVSVPGALEAPLALQKLAGSGRYDALVALGAVIRGETLHFEIVAYESAAGVSQVQLDTGVPVANGILTTDTDEQAAVRAPVKGRDCADVAIEMVNTLRAIERQHK
jgi:6,7-dimethyl-8-ribityllumazine synthase